ncbi:lysine biosynthesis protein LysW [Streptomyces termitum]|uniref:Lysine biosynthesis protein LysW n=1 Tax=Streptomyces termitum TaxID=67368 RepID=A0A918WBQ9_9ACTN|nr:lysine biosynthesis protein LysW [Streptomyces termitum]GHA98071.1 lysine biosynthesis protein LysW [Streptomyces termitum]
MQETLIASACPECDAEISLGQDIRVSEIVECPECRLELEIASVEPPQLILAPEVEEDWGE